MAEISSRKCFFFNNGYCKYKDKGCKILQPTERHVLPTCTNRDCPKRHQKLCRYKESCKFQKDLSCEYIHKAMVHCDNENNISTVQAKQLKQVTEKLINSEQIVSRIRLEVLKLERQNIEKMTLIENLMFKMENMNPIPEEESCNEVFVMAQEEPFKCNNCKDTNILKSNFYSIQSKFDNLLAKYSKSQKY